MAGKEYSETKKMNRNSWLGTVVKQQLVDCEIAVEVGVWRGDYSDAIMVSLNPKEFYGVDPYRLYPGMVSAPGPEYDTQAKLDDLALRVEARYEKKGAVLIRETSERASQMFDDNSVDFVYIDGDHTYEGVMLDIQCWWPKIRPGGILSGDDHTSGTTGKGYQFGVIEAVADFVRKQGLQLKVTTGANPSWWVTK